jgi:16S rRNA (cytosine967-C5)-methyltransferase
MNGLETRRFVLKILCDSSNVFKKKLLDETIQQHNFSVVDRSFIMELVQGITKRERTLSYLMNIYSRHASPDNTIRNIVYIGLYQLLFTEIAPYAAINTTVELAKSKKLGKVSSYINGLLRNVQRSISKIDTIQDDASILPLEIGGWKFSKSIFPNPISDLSSYLATVYSFPELLVQQWLKKYGIEQCKLLLQSANKIAPVFIRDRKGKLVDILQEKNIAYTIYNDLYKLENAVDLFQLPAFEEGLWTVNGTTSAEVIRCLNPQSNMKILDLCAAPGGKTLQIIDKIHGEGLVVAMDISEKRLQLLKKFGNLPNLQIRIGDGTQDYPEYQEFFDQVLVDAPCSNSAVFSKRADARHRFSMQNLKSLNKIQALLLESAAKMLKVGGILLYSTCSIEDAENREQIELFLKKHLEFKCIEQHEMIPLSPTFDGGSFCKLVKCGL